MEFVAIFFVGFLLFFHAFFHMNLFFFFSINSRSIFYYYLPAYNGFILCFICARRTAMVFSIFFVCI